MSKTSQGQHRARYTLEFKLEAVRLVLLCHKSSFTLALPQQGHCPRRAISS